jgi:hypothetical protein
VAPALVDTSHPLGWDHFRHWLTHLGQRHGRPDSRRRAPCRTGRDHPCHSLGALEGASDTAKRATVGARHKGEQSVLPEWERGSCESASSASGSSFLTGGPLSVRTDGTGRGCRSRTGS